MNIILFGPPGSGKGTQGDSLAKELNLFKVSTGDLLRKEISKRTTLGDKIKSLIDKGSLAPDDIIDDLIEKIISNKKYENRLIFDGYPRNFNQAKKLDELLKSNNQKISCVFNLLVDKEVIIKRILGRLICSKCGLTFNKYFNYPEKDKNCDHNLETRADDNKITIETRYETYLKETLPVINFYAEQKILHQISGMKKINQIYKEICSIITSLET